MSPTRTLIAALASPLALLACVAPDLEEDLEGREPEPTMAAAKKNDKSKGKGHKDVVGPPDREAPSACEALYSSDDAHAALASAVVDPHIDYTGEVATLILSFNSDDAVAPAAEAASAALGVELGEGLGAFSELPMLAVRAPLTRAVIDTLRSELQDFGLLSIYQDRPLEYFLDESVAYIGADTARHEYAATGAGVGVAVIDSGVDGTHGDFPTLDNNVKIVGPILDVGVSGALYVEAENTDLTSGHGTHVASTIAGSGAQSGGDFQGVAPGATLVGVGAGDAISILYALEGFEYVFQHDVREAHNIRVISNSWGTSGRRFAAFDPISIASKRAYDLGMVVNFAAGNEGSDPDTLNPYSASPCVISVAAGHAKDTREATNPLVRVGVPGELASFSSRGVPGDEFHHPDITLPGVNIVAARATSGTIVLPPYTGYHNDELHPWYASISGTSMATPHLSGVVAMMLEVNPELGLDEVLEVLTDTATPMFEVDGSRQLERWEAGAGYVDAYAALGQVAASAPTRYDTETRALDAWTGTVDASVAEAGVEGSHVHDIVVPEGGEALRVAADWGNPLLDLDLYLFDPTGTLVGSSAEFGTPGEAVEIPSPVAGTYRAELRGWLSAPTDYEGSAELDVLVPLE